MSESRALVARQPAGGGALITSLEDAARMAKFVADSKLFSCSNPAEAMVKIVAGMEMGFPAIASMSDIHIIEGKPSVGAHLMAAAIRRSGKYDFEIREHTDEVCSIVFFQLKDGQMKQVGVVTTTMKEAEEKGWTITKKGEKKATWIQKPKNMLFARTISDGYKFYTPDITGGMLVYDRDEIEPDPFAARQNIQVVSPPNAELPQLPHVENDPERSTPLTVNDDGSLRDELDDIMDTRQRIEGLIRELGFTVEQVKKKLSRDYGGASAIHAIGDLASLQRLEGELLAAKSKRLGNQKATA